MPEPTDSKQAVYRFGEFRLDVAARRLVRAGEPVALPPKAFELLRLLVEHADRAMTRTELLDAIWADTVVEEGSLSWNASVLRKALDDEAGEIVQTVRGYGYRFGLPVEPESATKTAAAGVSLAAAPAAAPEPGAPSAGRIAAVARRTRLLIWIAAFVALAILAATTFWKRSPPTASAAAGSAPVSRPALAVLPFENLSASVEHAWIATALAELLSTELELGGGATTIPGESLAAVAHDLGQRTGARPAADAVARLRRRLAFDQLVTGSYLVAGEPETLRVDFRIQEVAGREPSAPFVWSRQVALGELPRLVSEAGAELRRRFPPAGPALAEPPPPSSAAQAPTEALRLYSEALELERDYQPAAARDRLESAVAFAPGFVAARAALARLQSGLGHQRAALAESRRALAAAGSLPDIERLPIEATNLELEGRWAEAGHRWREIVGLSGGVLEPSLALARAESRAGRHDAARSILAELEARPAPAGADPRIVLERGWVERYGQDFAAMKAAGERGVELGRSLPSDFVLAEALTLVAWAELTVGDYARGLEHCTEGEAIAVRIGNASQRSLLAGLCGWLETNLGDGDAAQAWFEKSFAVAEEAGDVEKQASSLRALTMQHRERGEMMAARRLDERSLAIAREAGSLENESSSLLEIARIDRERGELPSAEELALQALARARTVNVASRIAAGLGELGRIQLLRGDVEAARKTLAEATEVTPRSSPGRVAIYTLLAARAALAADRPEEALAICEQTEASLADQPMPYLERLVAAALAGRAESALGRDAAARTRLELVEGHLEAFAARPTQVDLRLDHADLLADLGEAARAERAWEEILRERGFTELGLARATAAYRLAASRAARDPDPANRQGMAAAAAEARELRLGLLLGEKL